MPKTYVLPAGRYRLLGHGVGCSTLPPEGTMCLFGPFGGSRVPTGRYGADAPVFEIVDGRLTDAGEFILQAPVGTDMGEGSAVKFAQKNPGSFNVRVRPSTSAVPAAFQALPKGPAPSVGAPYGSAIRCAARPRGAMMYLPFDC